MLERADSSGARDTHCFERVRGKHVRDRHRVVVEGKVVYSGTTIYSVASGGVAFTYVSSVGGLGRGTVHAVPGGLDFAMTMRAAPGAPLADMTVQWRWRGKDAYEVAGDGAAPVRFVRSTG